jgi:ATP-dependent Lon protease
MAQKQRSSVAFVFDEIDKAGTSTHNGRVQDALLAFLEPETARRIADPYLQAACDVSGTTWLMTANDPKLLDAPFRDRCRLLRFPAPGVEHLDRLADQILRGLVTAAGLDAQWHVGFDHAELGALRAAWAGGSLRHLQKLVSRLFHLRNGVAPNAAH